MSGDELDAIRARAEAAPEGPWFRHYNDVVLATAIGNGEDIDSYVMRAEVDIPRGDRRAMATAEFIAHGRVDIPALIGEVEQLREYIDRMPYPSDMDQLRAERDRAEATIARVRKVVALLPAAADIEDGVSEHHSAALLRAIRADLLAAIEGTDS